MVRVHHLGTGSADPHPERGPTATWVEDGSASLLIDCGSGTLQRFLRSGGSLRSLDALLLTHEHLDHIADVAPLVFSFKLPWNRRERPLRIVASAATLALIERWQQAMAPQLSPDEGQVALVPLAPEQKLALTDAWGVQAHPVDHAPGSIGFLLEGPRRVRIAIPGDTGPCPSLQTLLDGCDLAILECGVPDHREVPGHLRPKDWEALLPLLRCGAIALVHRYAETLADPHLVERLDQALGAEVYAPSDGAIRYLHGR